MSWICPKNHEVPDGTRRCPTCKLGECGCPERAEGQHRFSCVVGAKAVTMPMLKLIVEGEG